MNRRFNAVSSRNHKTSTITTVLDDSSRRVLRNTYLLLSMCLAACALTAGFSLFFQLPHPGIVITMAGYFGLLFLVNKNRSTGWGVAYILALTGFMGYTLGPIIAHYLRLPNGAQTVMMAFGATAFIFMLMSTYALVSKRNLSFMAGMLSTGIIVAFLAGIGAIFLNMPFLSLAVSAVFVVLMSGMILFQTSNIVHGGETNYIMATVTLFVSLFNLFTSLLHLLGFANSSD